MNTFFNEISEHLMTEQTNNGNRLGQGLPSDASLVTVTAQTIAHSKDNKSLILAQLNNISLALFDLLPLADKSDFAQVKIQQLIDHAVQTRDSIEIGMYEHQGSKRK